MSRPPGGGPTAELALRLATGALATWRVAHLVVREDGPGDVVVKARERIGQHWVGELLDCFNCTSVWVGAAIAPVVTRRRPGILLTALALSGAACLLDRARRADEPAHVIELEPSKEEDGHGMLR